MNDNQTSNTNKNLSLHKLKECSLSSNLWCRKNLQHSSSKGFVSNTNFIQIFLETQVKAEISANYLDTNICQLLHNYLPSTICAFITL